MYGFHDLKDIDVEYSSEQIAALFFAMVSDKRFQQYEDSVYKRRDGLNNTEILILPVFDSSKTWLPIDALFITGCFSQLYNCLGFLIQNWERLDINALTNLSKIFATHFANINKAVLIQLTTILYKASYDLKRIKELFYSYQPLSEYTYSNPMREAHTLLGKEGTKQVNIFYPYIDEKARFFLIKVQLTQEPSQVQVTLSVYNYKGSLLPNESSNSLRRAIKKTWQELDDPRKLKFSKTEVTAFTAEESANCPEGCASVAFTQFLRVHLLEGEGKADVVAVTAMETRAYQARENDIALLVSTNCDSKFILALREKLLYVQYAIACSEGFILELCHILLEMAEVAIRLRAYSRARILFQRIKEHIRDDVGSAEGDEYIFADIQRRVDNRIAELKFTRSGDESCSDTLQCLVTERVKLSLQEHVQLTRDVQQHLSPNFDAYAELVLHLRQLLERESNSELRGIIHLILMKLRRPSSLEINAVTSLMGEASFDGTRSSGSKSLRNNHVKKNKQEMNTIGGMLIYLQDAAAMLKKRDDSCLLGELLDILEELITLYTDTKKINPSVENTSASVEVPVVFNGRAGFMRSDSKIFALDENGNLLKKAGGAGQSAIFYVPGLYTKGVLLTAPAGPGFQGSHDLFARLAFGVTTPAMQVMLVTHPNGLNYLLQSSNEIEGVLLHDWLKSHSPEELDPEAVITLAILSVILLDGDLKADNLIVDSDNVPINFDSDIHGKGSKEQAKAGQHFNLFRSVLLCLPQMDLPLPERIRQLILQLSPELLMLRWLAAVNAQNVKLAKLLAYLAPEQAAQYRDKLIVRYSTKFILHVYRSLKLMISLVDRNPKVTVNDLLREVDLASFLLYENVTKRHESGDSAEDVLARVKTIFQEGAGGSSEAKAIENILAASPLGSNPERLNLFLENDLGVIGLDDERQRLLPGELMADAIASMDFALLSANELGVLLTTIGKNVFLLSRLTLRLCERVTIEHIADIVQHAARLTLLRLEGLHSLLVEDIAGLLTENPTLDIELMLYDARLIPQYRKLAATHRGRFVLLTPAGSKLVLSNFFACQQQHKMLPFFLTEHTRPSALHFFIYGESVTAGRDVIFANTYMVHELVRLMYGSQEYMSLSSPRGHSEAQQNELREKELQSAPISKRTTFKGQHSAEEPTRNEEDIAAAPVVPKRDRESPVTSEFIKAWLRILHHFHYDINMFDTTGVAAIHLIAEYELVELFKFFVIELKGDVLLTTKTSHENIIHIILRYGQWELLRVVLELLPDEIVVELLTKQFDVSGLAPIHLAVQSKIAFDILFATQKVGVDFNVCSKLRLTPLQHALQTDCDEGVYSEDNKRAVVSSLLKKGFDGHGCKLSETVIATAERTANELMPILVAHYSTHQSGVKKKSNRTDKSGNEGVEKYCTELVGLADKLITNSKKEDKETRLEAIVQAMVFYTTIIRWYKLIGFSRDSITAVKTKRNALYPKLLRVFFTLGEIIPADSFSPAELLFLRERQLNSLRQCATSSSGLDSDLVCKSAWQELCQLLAQSITYNRGFLGEPPGSFSVYVLPAAGMDYSNIYSNIRFGFIVENGAKGNGILERYLRCLAMFVRLDILALGEIFVLPTEFVSSKKSALCLRDLRRGIRTDPSEMLLSTNVQVDLLVVNRQDILNIFSLNELWRAQSWLANMQLLTHDGKNFGKPEVVNDVRESLANSIRLQESTTNYLHALLEEFQRELFVPTQLDGVFTSEHIFFRLPFILLEQLCVCFKLPQGSFLENIDALQHAQHLSASLAILLTTYLGGFLSFITRLKLFYDEDKTIFLTSAHSLGSSDVFSASQKGKLYVCSKADKTDTLHSYLMLSFFLYKALDVFLFKNKDVFTLLSFDKERFSKAARVFPRFVFLEELTDVDFDDRESLVLRALACLRMRELPSMLGFIESLQEKGDENTRSTTLYLWALYFIDMNNHISAIEVLDVLASLLTETLQMEQAKRATKKRRARSHLHTRDDATGQKSESSISAISLGLVYHLRALSLRQLDKLDAALQDTLRAQETHKLYAIKCQYLIHDLLLAAKIKLELGLPSDAEIFYRRLARLAEFVVFDKPGLYASIARAYAKFTLCYKIGSEELLTKARKLMLKAYYLDRLVFGNESLTTLKNLFMCYKLYLISISDSDAKTAETILSEIELIIGILGISPQLITFFLTLSLKSPLDSIASAATDTPNMYTARALSMFQSRQWTIPLLDNVRLLAVHLKMASSTIWQNERNKVNSALQELKIFLELMLLTLELRCQSLQYPGFVARATVDVSHQKLIQLELTLIAMLKLAVTLNMPLTIRELTTRRLQFVRLLTLLCEHRDYDAVLNSLWHYMELHEHLQSPDNYILLLHVSELVFTCLEQRCPLKLEHVDKQGLLTSIDTCQVGDLSRILNTRGRFEPLPDESMQAEEFGKMEQYNVVLKKTRNIVLHLLSLLEPLFTNALSSFSLSLREAKTRAYAQMFRVISVNLTSTDSSLALIALQRLLSNVFIELQEISKIQLSPLSATEQQQLVLLRRTRGRPNKRTLQILLDPTLEHVQAYPALYACEARGQTLTLLFSDAGVREINQHVVESYLEYFGLQAASISCLRQTVIVDFDKSVDLLAFLHKLHFTNLAASKEARDAQLQSSLRSFADKSQQWHSQNDSAAKSVEQLSLWRKVLQPPQQEGQKSAALRNAEIASKGRLRLPAAPPRMDRQ